MQQRKDGAHQTNDQSASTLRRAEAGYRAHKAKAVPQLSNNEIFSPNRKWNEVSSRVCSAWSPYYRTDTKHWVMSKSVNLSQYLRFSKSKTITWFITIRCIVIIWWYDSMQLLLKPCIVPTAVTFTVFNGPFSPWALKKCFVLLYAPWWTFSRKHNTDTRLIVTKSASSVFSVGQRRLKSCSANTFSHGWWIYWIIKIFAIILLYCKLTLCISAYGITLLQKCFCFFLFIFLTCFIKY